MGVLEDAFGSLIEEYISDNAAEVAEVVGEHIDIDAIADKVKEEFDYENRITNLEEFNLNDMFDTLERLDSRMGDLENNGSDDAFSRDDLESELKTFTGLDKASLCSLGRAFNDAVESVVEREVKLNTEWQVEQAEAMVDNHPWFALVTDRLQALEANRPVATNVGFGVMWGQHSVSGEVAVYRRVVTGFKTAVEAREWISGSKNDDGDWTIVATVDSSRL